MNGEVMINILNAQKIIELLKEVKNIERGESKMKVTQLSKDEYKTIINNYTIYVKIHRDSDLTTLESTMRYENLGLALDDLPHIAKSILKDDKPAYEILQSIHNIFMNIDKYL